MLMGHFSSWLQRSSAVSLVLLSASDVYSSFPPDGIFGSQYDSCEHLWVFCFVGCHGSWWFHNFKRFNFLAFQFFLVILLLFFIYLYYLSCYCQFNFVMYCLYFNFSIMTDCIPTWWIWGFWVSPLMYAQNAASVNEFLGHSWNKVITLIWQLCTLIIKLTFHSYQYSIA